MTSFDVGDIVLVGFPFTNLQATKKRPAVIISQAEYNLNRPDVILMAITSQVRMPLSYGEYLLKDWQQAGLLKPSLLKPLIATVEQIQIIKPLGRLTPLDQQSLQDSLQRLVGVAST